MWFQYLFDETHPQESKYRCRLCYNYYDEFDLGPTTKNALAYKKGTLKSSMEANRLAIKKHSELKAHTTIIQMLQTRKKARLAQDFEKIQERENEKDDYMTAVTARMMRTVFVEIKRNIPFFFAYGTRGTAKT